MLFLRRPSGRRLILEALFWLAFFRLATKLVPFRKLAPLMGTMQTESDETVTKEQKIAASRIGQAILRCTTHFPWLQNCLVQALTGQAMLRRRNIAGTLYIGVALEAPQALNAHAWLRCGDLILTGRSGMERFKVISTFSTAPSRRRENSAEAAKG